MPKKYLSNQVTNNTCIRNASNFNPNKTLGLIDSESGLLRITPDHSGLLRITPDHSGSLRITPDHSGSLRITPDHSGSLRITPDHSRSGMTVHYRLDNSWWVHWLSNRTSNMYENWSGLIRSDPEWSGVIQSDPDWSGLIRTDPESNPVMIRSRSHILRTGVGTEVRTDYRVVFMFTFQNNFMVWKSFKAVFCVPIDIDAILYYPTVLCQLSNNHNCTCSTSSRLCCSEDCVCKTWIAA